MSKQEKTVVLSFKEWLRDKHGMSYNAFLSLVGYYQADLQRDYEAYRLNGSRLLSEFGLYTENEAKTKQYKSDFTDWLRKKFMLNIDQFRSLPIELKVKIYNKFWCDTYDI